MHSRAWNDRNWYCNHLFTSMRVVLCWWLMSFASEVFAQAKAPSDLPKLPTREIRVPFDDLPVLLGGTNQRMFMTRSEYDELLIQANVTPEQIAVARAQQLDERNIPTSVVMLDALHAVTIEAGRAVIQSDITIEVLKPGLQPVYLALQHVGLLEASLDNEPAMLSPSLDAIQPGATLLLNERGRHRLRLRMVAAVTTSAAQQTLTIALPHAAANKWTMNVPGNVEILSGAHVRSRRVDEAANMTLFEWMPNRSENGFLQRSCTIVMTLNNKLLRDTRALEAKSFLSTEITEAYEQVTQRVRINVLNGAENKFLIDIPNGFEVRKVQSPLLSRWNTLAKPQAAAGTEQVLEIELREPVSDQVVFDIVASKPARSNYSEQPVNWSWPVWRVLDADNQTAVLAISLEKGLRIQSLEYGDLIPLDEGVFTTALPDALRAREATAPKVRLVATMYAPDALQSIKAQITKPKSMAKSRLNILTIVGESGVRARALVELESGNESVANFEVSLPPSWRLQTAKLMDGVRLPFEVLNADSKPTVAAEPNGSTRTLIHLARPIAPNSLIQITLEASTVPNGWLSEWSEQPFAFPSIVILGTEAGSSVLATMAEPDFTIDVSMSENLLALFESERIALKIQGDGSGPSYSAQDGNWSLELIAKRKKAQLSAEVFSFFKIESDSIKVAYELRLAIKQASADSLQFSLPDSTPQELSIRGLDSVLVKESTSRIEGGDRIWSIKLAKRVSGAAKLFIEYSKNLETAVNLTLPIPKVIDTIYQTGVIALEGDDELEVAVLQHPRFADVGELTESSRSVGSRLLGVYGYSVGDQAGDVVSVNVSRRELQSIPTTIVERALLSTALSAHRASFHSAELRLRTTGGFIQAKLPPGAVLWSVVVDGMPPLPQRLYDQLLIELRTHSRVPATRNTTTSDPYLHVVRIAYETPINAIGLRTDIELAAPLLAMMQTATSPSSPIPTADMEWRIWMPEELRVIESYGDLRLFGDDAADGFPYNILSSLQLSRGWTADRFTGGTIRIYEMDKSKSLNSLQDMPTPSAAIGGSTIDNMARSRSDDSVARRGLPRSQGTAMPSPNFPMLQSDLSTTDPFEGGVVPSMPPVASSAQPPQSNTGSSIDVNGLAALAPQKSLDGLRTLPIDFQGPSTWHPFYLSGFGDSPIIRLSISNNNRLHWAAGALAALIAMIGLAFIGRPTLQVVRWTLAIMAFSIGVALLSPWPIETGILASGCFYAALAVFATRVLLGFGRSVGTMGFKNHQGILNGPTILVAIFFALAGSDATAQEATVGRDIRSLDELVSLMRLHTTTSNGPIEIPADAILVPYQQDSLYSAVGNEKVLVPYSVYNQLMDLAKPGKSTIKTIAPPVEYSLSNLSYETTLDRDDALEFSLKVNIIPHTETGLLIPFGFQGAVLTSTKLDDEPAAVSIEPNGLALLVKGNRAHQFVATFQIPVSRQGGWRIVSATLPTAPSGKMILNVPVANTEVRLIGLPDVEQRETTQASESIETSVAMDGKLSLQWRPKVSESVADQGLSVDADCALAVEEQGLHATWEVKLEFRRGRRDMFEFELPKDVVIERVTGKNIRGWTIDNQIDRQIVKVTLLKSAVESEQLTIVASRPMRLGAETEVLAKAPRLLVPEAMLQQGKITIYRSTLLELEVGNSNGLVREDLRADMQPIPSASPVPLKSFQAYRYRSTDFQLGLKVSKVSNKLMSQTETSLRVSRNDSRLQSEVKLSVGNRPLFRVRVELPADWQWDAPVSGEAMEWTLSDATDGAKIMDILFLKGQIGTVSLQLRASQNRKGDLQANEYTFNIPKIRTLDASSEEGAILVFADVGVDVRPVQLQGCEVVGNLAAASFPQRPAQANAQIPVPAAAPPKTILRFSSGNYHGLLRFQSRVPQVTAMSISNVKVTRRSLEETLYIEWEIKDSGLHRFEFTVPARLKDAVVLAQMVRSIQRFPVSEQIDAPVKCIIELQEDVMGQYRILVQKDSPLPSGVHLVPIPVILTGAVENRFVTLENSGRDEIVVDSLKGITQLVRGDSQWVKLQSLLGGKSADVYRIDERPVTAAANDPDSPNNSSMAFRSQSRSVVETASARIGLAQCVIAVDESSNYRATQEFRVENTSEAYLELEMPAG